MIYIFDRFDKFGESEYRAALTSLSLQRLEYIGKFRQQSDRYRSVLAYLLLSYGLRTEHGITAPPEFTYSENGKPYLRDYNKIFFCMSHCKNAVCCAVSDSEIGIDIESIRELRPAVVRRVCSEEERATVERAKLPNREFIRLWTMKEAYLKLTGKGIGTDMRTITDKIPVCKNMLCLQYEDYIMSCTQDMKVDFLSVEQLLSDKSS